MQIFVSGKHTDIGQALTEFTEAELYAHVKKYFEQAVRADVAIVKERHDFLVTISVNEGTGKNLLIRSSAREKDAYAAVSSAIEKIDKQLRRYKRRLKDHRKQSTGEAALEMEGRKYILSSEHADGADEAPDNPLIIAEKASLIERLSVSDAVMRMDLAELPALMFINSKTGAVNVVYRRADGNISWVDSSLDVVQAA